MAAAEAPELNESIDRNFAYIYANLEAPNWAPWLHFSEAELAAQSHVFLDGQFELEEEDLPVAILATNRIDWNGVAADLPTWDDIAGVNMTFEDTYCPQGNTLALMSMSVMSDKKGQHLPERLIGLLKDYAVAQEVDHIIGDFRPSGFSEYKRITGDFDFTKYIGLTRPEDNLPVDAWLRNVTRLGMQPLRVDNRAMVIPVSIDEFESYQQQYQPEQWRQITDENAIGQLMGQHQPKQDIEQISEVWECGETGSWYVNREAGAAVYVESNLWGEISH
ncbi:MAG: hypothetical protein JWO41_343 [Candidatus Saccharibacteria bacterium]|nr:hypothetical protein [Candidatus Saccharibacteria bacterium]